MKTDYAKVLKEAGRYDQVTDILVKIATGCNGYTYPVRPFIDDDFTSKWRVEGSSIRKQALRLLEIVVDGDEVKVIDEMSFTHISAYVESHADILLHNYAIHISHKIEPDVDMDEARNWLVLDNLIKCLHLPEEWTIPDGWKATPIDKAISKDSVNNDAKEIYPWRINYIVDESYGWVTRMCIIEATDETSAMKIFKDRVIPKLKQSTVGTVLDEFTSIKKCGDNVILYYDFK